MKIIFLIVLSAGILSAQDNVRGTENASIDEILDDVAVNEDVQQRGEELEYLKAHPVDIVHPSYGDLMSIPFMSPLLAESIILFSDTIQIGDPEQLKQAALMTPALYERIVPFITTASIRTNGNVKWILPNVFETRSRLEQRMQRTHGFLEHKYDGSPVASYQRVRVENTFLELAVMSEKDAGESIHDGYIAGYAEVRKLGFVDDWILGNYTASASQGLVFARNMASSKGSDAAGQIRKRGKITTPSTSTDEFRYFSGTALRLKISDVAVTGLLSKRILPASKDSNNVITSFYPSGLYRDDNERAKRNSVSEMMLGGIVEYSFDNRSSATLTAMRVEYGRVLNPALYRLENKRSAVAGSLGWDISLTGIRTFGEVATNAMEQFCSAAGFIVPITRTAAFSYHHRSYVKGYTAPFARPFGERYDIGDGEEGDYLGLEMKLGRTSVAAYIDRYELPSSEGMFSLTGKESFVQIVQPLSDRADLTAHVRNTLRSDISEQSRTNYRIGYTYRFNAMFTIAQRFERVMVSDLALRSNQSGYLSFVDCHYNNRKRGIVIRSRMVWFQSSGYDTRVYQYEPDLPGNFSNPPLYGSGLRWFLLVRYVLFNGCSLGMKYSETKKLHESVLGSGDDEIKGNLDSRVSIQADFQF